MRALLVAVCPPERRVGVTTLFAAVEAAIVVAVLHVVMPEPETGANTTDSLLEIVEACGNPSPQADAPIWSPMPACTPEAISGIPQCLTSNVLTEVKVSASLEC